MSSEKIYIVRILDMKKVMHIEVRSRHAQKCTKEKPHKLVSKNADGTFKCTKCTKVVKHIYKQYPETTHIMLV